MSYHNSDTLQLSNHTAALEDPVSSFSGKPIPSTAPMEEETELHYSPSQWVTTSTAQEAITQHVADVSRASKEARERVPHVLNLQYGKRGGQFCDLYGSDLPEDSPVFVYIHGGYWQMLSKEVSAYPVIPLWNAGIRCVVVGYDLTPRVPIDVIVEEIQDLALFIFEMVKEKGSKVWFGGHSAGAHLVASLLQADWLNSIPMQLKSQLKGVVLISGIYDITPLIHTSNNEALHLDRKFALRLSPLFKMGDTELDENCRVLIVVAEYDSPTFHGQSRSFGQLLKRKKINTEIMEIPDVDHFTVVTSLQDADSRLSRKIISLITNLDT